MPIKRLKNRALRARRRAKDTLDKKMDAKQFHAYIKALEAYTKGLERLHAKAVTAGKDAKARKLGKQIKDNYDKIKMARMVAEALERMESGDHGKPRTKVIGEQFT